MGSVGGGERGGGERKSTGKEFHGREEKNARPTTGTAQLNVGCRNVRYSPPPSGYKSIGGLFPFPFTGIEET